MLGFTPGDFVVCSYRIPSPNQYWLHPVHVGQVQQPGTDPKDWNCVNSEEDFCRSTGKLPILYSDGTKNHDSAENLVLAPEGKTTSWTLTSTEEAQQLENYVQHNAQATKAKQRHAPDAPAFLLKYRELPLSVEIVPVTVNHGGNRLLCVNLPGGKAVFAGGNEVFATEEQAKEAARNRLDFRIAEAQAHKDALQPAHPSKELLERALAIVENHPDADEHAEWVRAARRHLSD